MRSLHKLLEPCALRIYPLNVPMVNVMLKLLELEIKIIFL